MNKNEDITGMCFNEWTALYKDEKRNLNDKYNQIYWICKCSCGKIKSVNFGNLVSGKSKSCGHTKTTPPNFKDLTGQRFGRLVVLERNHLKKDATYWKCQCDCGNVVLVRSSKLISGHTQSCGCLQKENASKKHFKDLTGQRFYKLKVIERDMSRTDKTYWKCQCDCGTKISVYSGKLLSGYTKSCGCIKSWGEYQIKHILNNNNINYKNNYNFNDCLSEKNKKLPFDFAIFNDNKLQYLIEFDGEQHFGAVRGWLTLEKFYKLRERDLYKNKYCFDNNIPLIRIPYTKVNNLTIDDLMLETTDFLLTKSNENEYYKNLNKLK